MRNLVAICAVLAMGAPAFACIPAPGQVMYKECAMNMLEQSWVSEICFAEINTPGEKNLAVLVLKSTVLLDGQRVERSDLYPILGEKSIAGFMGVATTKYTVLARVATRTDKGEIGERLGVVVATNKQNGRRGISAEGNWLPFEGELKPAPVPKCI